MIATTAELKLRLAPAVAERPAATERPTASAAQRRGTLAERDRLATERQRQTTEDRPVIYPPGHYPGQRPVIRGPEIYLPGAYAGSLQVRAERLPAPMPRAAVRPWYLEPLRVEERPPLTQQEPTALVPAPQPPASFLTAVVTALAALSDGLPVMRLSPAAESPSLSSDTATGILLATWGAAARTMAAQVERLCETSTQAMRTQALLAKIHLAEVLLALAGYQSSTVFN